MKPLASIRTRFDLLRPSTAERVLAKQQAMKERYGGSTRDRTFAPEDKVYTKLGFEKEWAAATVKDFNGQIIDLELSDGRRCRRHLNNILKWREPEEPSEQATITPPQMRKRRTRVLRKSRRNKIRSLP